MKNMLLTLLAAAALTIPHANAQAFDSRVEASYESGSSGEGSWEMGKWDSYFFSYTRFFRPLGAGEGPYGEREFLERPPYIGLSVEAVQSEGYRDQYNIAPASVTLNKHEARVYTLSGMSYLGYLRRTGLGLRIELREDETKGSAPDKVSERAFALRVHQYLTEKLRVGFDYEKRDSDASWARRLNIYRADAVALIEEYRFEGWYRNLDEDLEALGLGVGGYPFRELGVFATYETIYGKYDFSTTLTLRGEYYVNEATCVTMQYEWIEEDSGYGRSDAVMLRLSRLL